MKSKLIFYTSSIEIIIDRADLSTRQLIVDNLYPFNCNRIGTKYTVSIRKAPEVLQLLRNINETNINDEKLFVPARICDAFYAELDKRTDQVFGDGDPVVSDTLTLDRHQQYAREMALKYDRFGFFYDTRTGKTPLSLSIINDDIQHNPKHKWLVVCPLILIDNAWIEDVLKFVPNIKISKCHATTKAKRLEAIKAEANVYIMNTESFVSYMDYFVDMQGCIVDESSSMKSNSSKISKALVDYSTRVKRWYLLSGTPAPNGEWEYYMQLKSIDYYCVPQSYNQFKERYFINVSRNPQYDNLVLRLDRKDELYKIIHNYCIYADKEDVLTTPGRDVYEINYDMSPESMKAYAMMKDKLCIELDEELDEKKVITAVSAAAMYNKLNQIASGFVIDTQAIKQNKYNDTDLIECYDITNGRIELLKDLLDTIESNEPGSQVIIWANYHEEFRMIEELLNNNCVKINGEVNILQKNEFIKSFKAGEVKYMVANPSSADKGLTLTNAHYAIYYSLNFSYEKHKQSMDRIYADIKRQPYRCKYYIIIANKTINDTIYHKVLQGKQAASYAILNHIRGDFNATENS